MKAVARDTGFTSRTYAVRQAAERHATSRTLNNQIAQYRSTCINAKQRETSDAGGGPVLRAPAKVLCDVVVR